MLKPVPLSEVTYSVSARAIAAHDGALASGLDAAAASAAGTEAAWQRIEQDRAAARLPHPAGVVTPSRTLTQEEVDRLFR